MSEDREAGGRAPRPWQVLCVSAATAPALEAATDRLVERLRRRPEEGLADLAWDLQEAETKTGDIGEHRRALVCNGREDALAALAARDPRRVLGAVSSRRDRPVAFLFSGLGEQYPGMARGLYEAEPVFRRELDRAATLLEPHLGLDLRTLLFPAAPAAASTPAPASGAAGGSRPKLDLKAMLGRGAAAAPAPLGPLERTAILQPAFFAIEHALGRLWMEWGIAARGMIGYSLGEYVAACLAGVLSLPDALRLVAERARLVDELPPGAMLAVPFTEEELRPLIASTGGEAELSIAVLNGVKTTVVAGPLPAVAELEGRLTAQGLACRRLRTTHAFHSTMMRPVAERLTALARQVELHPPERPYVSNVSGTWITPQQATDPGYWAEHLCRTVRFADGIAVLWQEPERVLLEIGPGQSLSALALQHPASAGAADPVALPSLPAAYERRPDQELLLDTLAKLWLAGVAIDWRAFHARGERRSP
ncbi:MAG TPA: acyltransferase domain-containing protein [Thermoanaerobaculia bacterium]|nr:acyltransferase domain-containing protein [Thermoanaerobaculia bacterium]